MISDRLKNIFLISIPLFIIHGVEEYITGFYLISPIFKVLFIGQRFENIYQSAFFTFHIMLWLCLIISYLLLIGGKWVIRLMVLLGLIYIFEIHHIIDALIVRDYYPGLITSFVFPIIAFFYWKELVRHLRK